MFPPVGDGTGQMIGQMKQSPMMNSSIAAGIVTPIEPRHRPRDLAAAASSSEGATPGYDEITRQVGHT